MGEFLHHFGELWADPAHLAYEISVDLVVNTVFLGLLWPVVKRVVRKHDAAVHSTTEEASDDHNRQAVDAR